MAQELNVSMELELVNGSLAAKKTITKGSVRPTQASALLVENVQALTTVQEALVMGDVVASGYAYFRNIGTTNNVLVGTLLGLPVEPMLRLKPGEAAVVRLATNAPYAKAEAGTATIHYLICSE